VGGGEGVELGLGLRLGLGQRLGLRLGPGLGLGLELWIGSRIGAQDSPHRHRAVVADAPLQHRTAPAKHARECARF